MSRKKWGGGEKIFKKGWAGRREKIGGGREKKGAREKIKGWAGKKYPPARGKKGASPPEKVTRIN